MESRQSAVGSRQFQRIRRLDPCESDRGSIIPVNGYWSSLDSSNPVAKCICDRDRYRYQISVRNTQADSNIDSDLADCRLPTADCRLPTADCCGKMKRYIRERRS